MKRIKKYKKPEKTKKSTYNFNKEVKGKK